MPTRSVFRNMVFVGIVFFALSCGQRGMPTGGQKDTTPPQIISSAPENFSTNFKGQEIELKFDEYVQVRSFQKEFLISPPVPVAPSYRLRGKRLVLSFDSAFTANTTYTLFFGKSIVDLNESNPLDSNLFVFSTGAIIDSLTLTGEIIDGKTLAPENEMMVLLYKNLADSAPKTEIPSYFAPAKNGRFQFSNLAAGTYRIFALQDANQNYKYDLATEKIAYLQEPISVPADSSELILRSFVAPPPAQKVFKPSSDKEGFLQCTFTLPPDSVRIESIGDDWPVDSVFRYWNTTHDTLVCISAAFTTGRKFKLLVHADTSTSDTANVTIGKKKSSLSFQSNFNEQFKNNFNDSLKWIASEPLLNAPDSVIVVGAGDSSWVRIRRAINPRTIYLEKRFLAGENYRISFPDSAFESVLNHYSSSRLYNFNMESEGVFGQLIVHFKAPKQQYLVQLFQGPSIIATRVLRPHQNQLLFTGLRAGDYSIHLIQDEQEDERWSPGNYDQGILPEKVLPYPKPITIRANWDLEIEWELK